jgi:alkylated DNA nucleotide flippase Atl1
MAEKKSKKKTATEKYFNGRAHEIIVADEKLAAAWGAGKMLIATPALVDEVICKIPPGEVMTVSALRKALAQKFEANYSCPLTTGIFWRIVAEKTEEDRLAGKKTLSPYWRVVYDDGKLNEKLPGGADAQAKILSEEGVTLIKKRDKFLVESLIKTKK